MWFILKQSNLFIQVQIVELDYKKSYAVRLTEHANDNKVHMFIFDEAKEVKLSRSSKGQIHY